MSNSGPAPWVNRNSGLGCQDSGAPVWNTNEPVSTSPISPDATARSAVWMPGPSIGSGAHARRSPFSSASASSSRASWEAIAIGFSDHTCLPASRIRRSTSAWAAGIVRFTTMPTSSRARSSSTVPAASSPEPSRTSNSSARARARSTSRSARKRTSTSGNCQRLRRYCSEITPVPMMPTPRAPGALAGCGSSDSGTTVAAFGSTTSVAGASSVTVSPASTSVAAPPGAPVVTGAGASWAEDVTSPVRVTSPVAVPSSCGVIGPPPRARPSHRRSRPARRGTRRCPRRRRPRSRRTRPRAGPAGRPRGSPARPPRPVRRASAP